MRKNVSALNISTSEYVAFHMTLTHAQ